MKFINKLGIAFGVLVAVLSTSSTAATIENDSAEAAGKVNRKDGPVPMTASEMDKVSAAGTSHAGGDHGHHDAPVPKRHR